MAEEAETFGKAIRERRKAMGLSQRELAEKLPGKTEGKDISRYELGKHMPGQNTRTALAVALKTTLAKLYAGPVADRKKPKKGDLRKLGLNGAAPGPEEFSDPDARLLSGQIAALHVDVAALADEIQVTLRRSQEPVVGQFELRGCRRHGLRSVAMPKRSRKPADLNRLAASIVSDATDQSDPESESPHAAAGRKGGAKGGRARAAALSPEERSTIARRAAKARWGDKQG